MKKTILISILSSIVFIPYAVADQAIVQARNSPPGLQGKGGAEFPRGLENSEKTPAGWSEGEKRGWSRTHHHRHHHQHHADHDRD